MNNSNNNRASLDIYYQDPSNTQYVIQDYNEIAEVYVIMIMQDFKDHHIQEFQLQLIQMYSINIFGER